MVYYVFLKVGVYNEEVIWSDVDIDDISFIVVLNFVKILNV